VLADHLVGGRPVLLLLEVLLEERLEVQRVLVLLHRDDLVVQVADAELPRLLEAAVEIDRRDHRLEDVGEERVRELASVRDALADLERVIEPEPLRLRREGVRGDDHRLDLGQLPLGEIIEEVEEELGHHEAEDGVPEELHPLVAGVVDRLDRGVGERLQEMVGILEGVADPLLARFEALEILRRNMLVLEAAWTCHRPFHWGLPGGGRPDSSLRDHAWRGRFPMPEWSRAHSSTISDPAAAGADGPLPWYRQFRGRDAPRNRTGSPEPRGPRTFSEDGAVSRTARGGRSPSGPRRPASERGGSRRGA